MSKLIDLTGKTFGHLIVLQRVDDNILPSGLHEPMWLCQCDCGNQTVVRGAFLRSGHTTSCGCHQTGDNFNDLTGRKFGSVTVCERVGTKSPVMWLCRCDCGRVFVTRGSSLCNGHTKSCGCRKKQLRIEAMPGQRFGRLIVLHRGQDEFSSNGTRFVRWVCRCDCGREVLVRGSSLRSGHTVSCGCQRIDSLKVRPASRGEIWISQWLSKQNLSFTTQKSFPSLVGVNGGLLTFDFEIDMADQKVLVECQGEQHFRPVEYFGGVEQFKVQQEHDRRKLDYVQNHPGYYLITIDFRVGVTQENINTQLEEALFDLKDMTQ